MFHRELPAKPPRRQSGAGLTEYGKFTTALPHRWEQFALMRTVRLL
jgi:hypothetical protein